MSLSAYSNCFRIISPTFSIDKRNKPFPDVPKQVLPPLACFYIKEELQQIIRRALEPKDRSSEASTFFKMYEGPLKATVSDAYRDKLPMECYNFCQ